MSLIKHLTNLAAVALIALAANAFAADYYLKIDGIKGERARLIHCMDGACAIEGLTPGSFTVTLCDAKGNPLPAGSATLNITFTAASIRESPTKQSLRESPTRASTGATASVTTGVVSPRDAASGLNTGKRQHGVVTISKEWDAASPQLALRTPSGADYQDVMKWTLEVRVDRIEMK